ncbi:MAG: DNA polymerase III subunit delta [Opitutales bacterium]
MPAKTASFQFVCGDDDFLVSRRGREIFERLAEGSDGDGFGPEVIEGAAGNVAEVESAVNEFRAAANTLPLFGGRKIIWLRGVNFLADSVTGRAEGTKVQVEQLQQALVAIDPELVAVVITAFPVDRRRKEFKWFQKNGQTSDLKGGDALESIAPELERMCQESGVTFAPGVEEDLIGQVGGNARLAVAETQKLVTYLGTEGGTLTRQMVVELVPSFGEGDFFEAAEAFFSGNLEWTLDALRRHFYVQKEARGLISTMQNRVRILIQLQALVDAGEIRLGPRGLGKGALEAAGSRWSQAFGEDAPKSSYNIFSQNAWYVGNRLAPALDHFNLRRLLQVEDALLGAFRAIHDRPDDQEGVLRELACRCLG